MGSYRKNVKDYYNYADIAYRFLWRDRESLGMHFGFWDNYTKSHKQSLLNQNILMAKICKVSSNDKILDAGCGVGGSSIWLTKKFKAKVHGISISEKQIRKAKHNAKNNNLEKEIKFSVQDYSKTRFSDNNFTLIWVQESLPHEADKLNFLKEAYRILKKGGRLISSDYFKIKENYSKNEINLMGVFTKGWAMASFISPNEFIKLAKIAGFKKLKYYNTTNLIEPSLKRLRTAYFFFKPLAEIFDLLGIPMKTNKANINAVKAGYKAYEQKLWGHGIIYAEK